MSELHSGPKRRGERAVERGCGIDLVLQPVGLLALIVAHQQTTPRSTRSVSVPYRGPHIVLAVRRRPTGTASKATPRIACRSRHPSAVARRGARHWRGILRQAHHGAQPVEGLRHLIRLGRPPIAISPSPAVFSNESNSSSVISMASVIAAAEASITLRTSWCVFHLPNSSAACRSWPRSSATSETHSGIDAGHQPIGFLAFVIADQQPAGAAGDVDHVRASLVEDQSWPARDRSQRLGSAATRELRLLISGAMVPATSACCSPADPGANHSI
jgi:hypothetical protein